MHRGLYILVFCCFVYDADDCLCLYDNRCRCERLEIAFLRYGMGERSCYVRTIVPTPFVNGITHALASCLRVELGWRSFAPEADEVFAMTSRPCGAAAAPDTPPGAGTTVIVTLPDTGSTSTVSNTPASSDSIAENGAMNTLLRSESRVSNFTVGDVERTFPPRACQPKSGWSTSTVPMPSACPTKLGP